VTYRLAVTGAATIDNAVMIEACTGPTARGMAVFTSIGGSYVTSRFLVTLVTSTDDSGVIKARASPSSGVMAVLAIIGRLYVSTRFLVTLRTSVNNASVIESRRVPIHRVVTSAALLIRGYVTFGFLVAVTAGTHDRAMIHGLGIPTKGGMAIITIVGGIRMARTLTRCNAAVVATVTLGWSAFKYPTQVTVITFNASMGATQWEPGAEVIKVGANLSC